MPLGSVVGPSIVRSKCSRIFSTYKSVRTGGISFVRIHLWGKLIAFSWYVLRGMIKTTMTSSLICLQIIAGIACHWNTRDSGFLENQSNILWCRMGLLFPRIHGYRDEWSRWNAARQIDEQAIADNSERTKGNLQTDYCLLPHSLTLTSRTGTNSTTFFRFYHYYRYLAHLDGRKKNGKGLWRHRTEVRCKGGPGPGRRYPGPRRL